MLVLIDQLHRLNLLIAFFSCLVHLGDANEVLRLDVPCLAFVHIFVAPVFSFSKGVVSVTLGKVFGFNAAVELKLGLFLVQILEIRNNCLLLVLFVVFAIERVRHYIRLLFAPL